MATDLKSEKIIEELSFDDLTHKEKIKVSCCSKSNWYNFHKCPKCKYRKVCEDLT